MCEVKKERRQVFRGPNLAASSVLLSTILLAGCSSVGSALNPLDWFGSSDQSTSAKENPPDDSGFPKIRNDKRPDVATTKERSDLTKGLAADHSNAKYTQDVLRREGNPTRPLGIESAVAPKDDVSAQTPAVSPVTSPVFVKPSVTQAPAAETAPVSAAPAVTAPATSATAPAPTVASMREQSAVAQPEAASAAAVVPAKPDVVVDDTPPPPPPKLPPSTVAASAPAQTASAAPAPAPAAVEQASSATATAVVAPAPASTAPVSEAKVAAPAAVTAPSPVAEPAPASVDEVYRRRLAEFSSGTTSSPSALTAPAAKPLAPAAEAAPATVLLSPAEYRRTLSHDNGGARPLDAFDGTRSAASFQVAAVRFGEGTAELSAAEIAHLRDVVALYREKGGSIRVLGRSASPRLDIDAKANLLANRQLAGGRAAAIARELIKLGIPARKIYAGAVPSTGAASASNGESTEIYIDY
ncbi:OmpA family protein [Telmatospirillum siberiense]|uniref:OmpA-like domain-containing protein n=1 Tax=Telmatospirillum siberiense TaxID=382514 RepID=A0A2N3PRN9_9PROT|nr:OmpA family protein [Telmatospirillum siberiense]PKU23061.1 hypothetical protein CWS72_18710 [Telmatospirillum siberiense]